MDRERLEAVSGTGIIARDQLESLLRFLTENMAHLMVIVQKSN